MVNIIEIKPLSINKAYTGKRFKTKEYRTYKNVLMFLLKPMEVPAGKLELNIEFGFSSKGSDVDNCVKNFTDVLQKKYGFNDNMIYKLVAVKEIVPKGKEYIKFKLTSYQQTNIFN